MLGESPKKWRILLFIFLAGLVLASSLIHIMTVPSQTDSSQAEIRNTGPMLQSMSLGKLVLVKGRKQSLGSLQIIYRGLEANAILIDITLMELDPQYAYRHRISLKRAKHGFQMADRKFRLMSATPSRLKISLNKG